MSNSKQKTVAVLAGSVALASGAYALGSQSDGNAVADGNRPPHLVGGPGYGVHFDGGPGLAGLADRLGVDADALRDALEDVRGTLPDPHELRSDFAKELADELGTTQAKVEAALERIRKRHEQELKDRGDAVAEALAKRLNLSADKVKEALQAPRFFERPGP